MIEEHKGLVIVQMPGSFVGDFNIRISQSKPRQCASKKGSNGPRFVLPISSHVTITIFGVSESIRLNIWVPAKK